MNRCQARMLIPSVIDNEVSETERDTFLQFIRSHPDLQQEYEDALRLKRYLSEDLPKIKAPDRLRKSILRMIDDMEKN